MPVTQQAIDRTKQKFAVASANRIPPYNWIPPENPPLLETLTQVDFLDENLPECEKIEAPNPDSGFKHFDEDHQNFHTAENKAAFQRLESAFDFIVCRTRELCLEINEGVKFYDAKKEATWGRYINARQAYIEFLQNLDNHEPGPADLKKGLGYGKHYRWLFVDPIIREVDIKEVGVKPLITGAIIVLLWNPHSSSSGIPIKHP